MSPMKRGVRARRARPPRPTGFQPGGRRSAQEPVEQLVGPLAPAEARRTRRRCAARRACRPPTASRRRGARGRTPSSARRCARARPAAGRPPPAPGRARWWSRWRRSRRGRRSPARSRCRARVIAAPIEAARSAANSSRIAAKPRARRPPWPSARGQARRVLEAAQGEEVVPVGVHRLGRVALVADRGRQQPEELLLARRAPLGGAPLLAQRVEVGRGRARTARPHGARPARGRRCSGSTRRPGR